MMSWLFIASALRETLELVGGEEAIAPLRLLHYARDALGRGFVSVRLEPEDDIRFAGHRADLDALLASQDRRRHAAVHPIGERAVALAQRLDHRGRVHARAGAEGILTQRRIVRG